MKVGLYLSTQWPRSTPPEAAIARLIEQVKVARDSGFSSVWVMHHYLSSPVQTLQPVPILARLSGYAEGMALGTAILLLPLTDPVVVAEEFATLDWLSGGRAVLGVGLGYRKEEFSGLGVPWAERVQRMESYIGLIRKLWGSDSVRHEDENRRLEQAGLALMPKQAGGPPIWVAGEVPTAVRRAAKIGDTWLPLPATTLSETRALWNVFDEERSSLGLDVEAERPLIRECYVGKSISHAFDAVREPLRNKYGIGAAAKEKVTYRSQGMQKATMRGATADDFTGFAQDRFLIGDESRVWDDVQRFKQELSTSHFVMRTQWHGVEQDMTIASIRRIGRLFNR